jgi:hypothetical protein
MRRYVENELQLSAASHPPNHTHTYTWYSLATVIRNGSHKGHLFQMFRGVVGMNHLVLDGTVIATKDVDRFATGMIKVGNVVNPPVDYNLIGCQRFDGSSGGGGFRRRSVIHHLLLLHLPVSQLIRIGGHGRLVVPCCDAGDVALLR